MAFIALTGIGMQTIDLISPEHHGPPVLTGDHGPAPGMPDQGDPGPLAGPRQPRRLDFRGWLDHIHDGEIAGNTGRVFSLAFGIALLFFSVSGIWMYAKMFGARRRNGAPKMFW